MKLATFKAMMTVAFALASAMFAFLATALVIKLSPSNHLAQTRQVFSEAGLEHDRTPAEVVAYRWPADTPGQAAGRPGWVDMPVGPEIWAPPVERARELPKAVTAPPKPPRDSEVAQNKSPRDSEVAQAVCLRNGMETVWNAARKSWRCRR